MQAGPRRSLPDSWNRVVDRLLEKPHLAAALAALGLSVSLVLTFGFPGDLGERGASDAETARALASGDGAASFDHGVLGPFILLAAFRLLGPDAVWVKLVAFAAHAIALAGLYLLTRDHVERGGASNTFPSTSVPWLVVAVFASHPLVILGVASGHPGALAALAFVALAQAAVRVIDGAGAGVAMFAGALAALVILARPGLLAAVLAVGLAVTLLSPRKTRLGAGLGYAAGCVTLLSPWLVWSGARAGASTWREALGVLLGASFPGTGSFPTLLVLHGLVLLGAFALVALVAPFRITASLRRAFVDSDAAAALLWIAAVAALAAGAFEAALVGSSVVDGLVLALPAVPLLIWLVAREAAEAPAPRPMRLEGSGGVADEPLPPWLEWPPWMRIPRKDSVGPDPPRE